MSLEPLHGVKSELLEFDLSTGRFVEHGFNIPAESDGYNSKFNGISNIIWVDEDTVLVTTNWEKSGEDLNKQGSATKFKLWKRGRPLASATEVFSPQKVAVRDARVSAAVIRTSDGGPKIIFGEYNSRDAQSQWWVQNESGKLEPVDWCAKGGCEQNSLRVLGVDDNKFLIQAMRSARVSGITIPRGAIVEIPIAGPATQSNIKFIFTPADNQTTPLLAVLSGKRLVVPITEDVNGGLLLFESDGTEWHQSRVSVPAHSTIRLPWLAAAEAGEGVYVEIQGLLTPPNLYRLDEKSGRLVPLAKPPEKFSTGGLSVVQNFARSSDGSKIPYYLVGTAGNNLGPKPTIIRGYGYGGTAELPLYDPLLGKLWLEKGRNYVIANIRGGGEYSDWDVKGLERRRVYEDFIAVSEDLVRRGITTPSQLFAAGHSNGGILVGNVLNRRPDLFRGAVIQNAVLDLATWQAGDIRNYGDLTDPQGRANRLVQSPYHTILPNEAYPTPLITTNSDDHIEPSMSRRFAHRIADLGQDYYYFEGEDGEHDVALTPKDRTAYYSMMFTYMDQQLELRK